MKNFKLLYVLPLVVAAIFTSTTVFPNLTNFTMLNRAGDVPGPGVTTSKNCTTCHTGVSTVTNSSTKRIFTLDSGSNVYVPNRLYTIKFKIIGTGPVGFSATVLKNDSNVMTGTLASADTAETKLFLHIASGRYYLNHRTGTTTAGAKEYTFTWKAPAKGAGAVTFYFSSLSSNNDQSPSDDTTYLNTYVLTEASPTTGITDVAPAKSCMAYPNPATDRLNVSFLNPSSSLTEVMLYSLNGKVSMSLFKGELNGGEHTLAFNLPEGIKPGIYLVHVSNSGFNSIQKVILH